MASQPVTPFHHSIGVYAYLLPTLLFTLPSLSLYIRRMNAIGLPYWFNVISSFYSIGASLIYTIVSLTAPHMFANSVTGLPTIPIWVWPTYLFALWIFVCSFIRTRYTASHPNPSVPSARSDHQGPNGPQGFDQDQ